jgi:hypothetical protein
MSGISFQLDGIEVDDVVGEFGFLDKDDIAFFADGRPIGREGRGGQ